MDYKNQGVIIGMENMGAIYISQDDDKLYFKIPQTSLLYNDEDMRRRAARACRLLTGKSVHVTFVPPRLISDRKWSVDIPPKLYE